ncbi:hypothetical protein QL285_027389 [Trifolium repens]|nr:hypothetical protein QL285_027389 [Trifolium repens]
MSSNKKKTLQIRAQLPDVESLKAFNSQLTSMARDHFTFKYGKILNLLNVPVQVEAVTALAQFYDPPLRCFTFQDFQLAPTLEEFGQILDSPKKKLVPYKGIGQVPKLEDLAVLLKVSDLSLHFKTERDTLGFRRYYLEKKATKFANAQDWESLGEILALLIFGLVLFPNQKNFIDVAAISVFWAVRVNGEDPVPALLADIYYTLHMRYKKKRGLMLCCVPLLYLWFTSQIFKDICTIETMNGHDWSQKMMSLTERSILWYARKINEGEVIISCGDFPNVPLIGSRGCINYNPILSIRQLGYPMLRKPDDEVLKEFVLDDTNTNDPRILQRVIRSWAQVHRKGNELRKRGVAINEPYSQWIKERVKKIQLPFILIPSSQPSPPEPVLTSVEEVDVLKATIEHLEKEKEDLQQQLHQTSYERNKFKFHFEEKTKQLKRSKEMVEEERVKKERVDECLEGVTNKMRERNDRLNQAWKEINDWKDLWNRTLKERKEMREGFEARILNLTATLKESQTIASNEHQLREEANRKLQNLSASRENLLMDLRGLKEHEERQRQDLEALEDRARHLESQLHHMTELASHDQTTIQELHHEAIKWKTEFSNLAEFANNVVRGIPSLHKKAYAVLFPNNTPVAVFNFVESCGTMLREFKDSLDMARKAKL